MEFEDRNLAGSRFVRCDLSGSVLRGVVADGMEIDSPWLLEGDGSLVVNGVDVTGFVDAELDRRFPGRALRAAEGPDGLRAAWSAVQAAWAATIARAQALPEGSLDVSVAGEWSFAQTLRHLVMATDVWLTRTAIGSDEPLHPIGQPNVEYESDGGDPAVFSEREPTFERVLEVRADRVDRVTDFLSAVTEEELSAERRNPWGSDYPETVLSCIRTILEEEWEHLRYAVRDLETIERVASA